MNASAEAHQEAQELLPWLANGTLAGTELERVQAHLQGCPACRAELALLHTLRAAGADPAEDGAGDADAQAALARLLPQLDAPATAMPAALPVSGPHGWRARLAANDGSWLRVAVAVQACAIVALGALLAWPSPHPEAQPGAYRLLGATPGPSSSLAVIFKPDTPERELRRIVQDSGAHVVGGPTVTGAWLLDTDQAPDAVLARLHAEPAVTLAEQLGIEDRP